MEKHNNQVGIIFPLSFFLISVIYFSICLVFAYVPAFILLPLSLILSLDELLLH